MTHRLESVGVSLADSDASLDQKAFNISVAEVESVVEPDGVRNDICWRVAVGICDVCMYSSPDSTSLGRFTCQHRDQWSLAGFGRKGC